MPHVRFNGLMDLEPIPTGAVYASAIGPDVPVAIRRTRLNCARPRTPL